MELHVFEDAVGEDSALGLVQIQPHTTVRYMASSRTDTLHKPLLRTVRIRSPHPISVLSVGTIT